MKQILVAMTILLSLSACDQRSAKEIGEAIAQEKVDLIQGVGGVVKEQGEGVASTVAEGVGNVFSGLGKGFDESLTKKQIKVDANISATKVEISRAQQITSSTREGMSVYILSKDGVEGSFILKAFSGEKEVGRSDAQVSIEKDGAKFVDFEFDNRTPFGSVDYYLLSEK